MRHARYVLLVLVTAASGLGAAHLAREVSHGHVTLDDLAEAFEQETQVARDDGIDRLVREGTLDDAAMPLALELGAGECAALVVAVGGPEQSERYAYGSFQDGAETLASLADPRQRVTQAQLCALGGRRRVEVSAALARSFGSRSEIPTPGVYRILRSGSRRPDPRALSRLSWTPMVREQVGQREARVQAAPAPLGRSLGELTIARAHGARLLPESEATFAALRSAVLRHARAPAPALRVTPIRTLEVPSHRRSLAERPSGEGLLPHVTLDAAGPALRVLAAVDLGDLRAGCVALRFTRMTTYLRPPDVVRLDVPSFEHRALARDERHSEDRACPAEGLVVYAVPGGDHGDYRLSLYALDDAHASPRPSPYRGALDDPPAVVSARPLCAAGDGEACVRLGHAYRAIGYPEPHAADARAAFARACELDMIDGCLFEALARQPRDIELLVRACGRRSSRACGLAADALRLGEGVPPDYARARRAYRRACGLGSTSACTNLRAMRHYRLGGGEEASDDELGPL